MSQQRRELELMGLPVVKGSGRDEPSHEEEMQTQMNTLNALERRKQRIRLWLDNMFPANQAATGLRGAGRL